MAPSPPGAIYSATYSNVPVFEFNVDGNHVMRRRHDDWINATHILKVADYDKPQRTRILEREVQKGIHEKVQGGYGKYQGWDRASTTGLSKVAELSPIGTWVPLNDGRTLAERNHVLHKLQALFDYVPGDKSPPQAPKHATNKPKVPRLMPPVRKQKAKPRPNPSQMSDDPYDNISAQLNDDESIENSSMISGSFMDEDDVYRNNYAGGSRKRKRAPEVAVAEQHHRMYGDTLLDYFVLASDDEAPGGLEPPLPPIPPPGYPPDRVIDDLGHTAVHWAAAMGDLPVVRIFLERHADIAARNIRGETPLIRAVIFTNNYEKGIMSQLLELLKDTICIQDNFNGTILHHVAATTHSHSRKKSARYYLDVLLNRLSQLLPPHEFSNFLNARDLKGDTALHIVARNNARKCVRTLLGRGAVGDLRNNDRETADQLIHLARAARHEDYALASSSPAQGLILTNGYASARPSAHALITQPLPNYTTAAARSFSSSFGPIVSGKGLQIALALDSEVQDKDTDIAEAQRLLQNAEQDRQLVRQKTFTLMTTMHVGEDEQELDDLTCEHVDLRAVALSYLEQTQHRSLHGEVLAKEQRLPAAAYQPQTNGMTSPSEDSVKEKCQLAMELAAQQDARKEWVNAVVHAQATAGMSYRGESCKQLIASLAGVSHDEVVGLVPELLEELEMGRMDGRGAKAGIVV